MRNKIIYYICLYLHSFRCSFFSEFPDLLLLSFLACSHQYYQMGGQRLPTYFQSVVRAYNFHWYLDEGVRGKRTYCQKGFRLIVSAFLSPLVRNIFVFCFCSCLFVWGRQSLFWGPVQDIQEQIGNPGNLPLVILFMSQGSQMVHLLLITFQSHLCLFSVSCPVFLVLRRRTWELMGSSVTLQWEIPTSSLSTT